jgi:hypothetical protein
MKQLFSWDYLRPARHALIATIFYWAMTIIAATLLSTIVAYLVSAANKVGEEFVNTVNEISGQYLIFSFSLAAFLTSLTLWFGDRALYRARIFWTEPQRSIWQLNRNHKAELKRGLYSGLILGGIILALLLLSGRGSYLGLYLTSALGTPVFPLFLLSLGSSVVLLVTEEYLFRHKFMWALQNYGNAIAIGLTVLVATLFKLLQFHLDHIALLNTALLQLLLSIYFVRSQKCHRGIALLVSLIVFWHPLAGLPLWGVETPSLFLFKSQSTTDDWLFGGGGGPFSGLALTAALIFLTISGWYSWRQEEEEKRQGARRQKA